MSDGDNDDDSDKIILSVFFRVNWTHSLQVFVVIHIII